MLSQLANCRQYPESLQKTHHWPQGHCRRRDTVPRLSLRWLPQRPVFGGGFFFPQEARAKPGIFRGPQASSLPLPVALATGPHWVIFRVKVS